MRTEWMNALRQVGQDRGILRVKDVRARRSNETAGIHDIARRETADLDTTDGFGRLLALAPGHDHADPMAGMHQAFGQLARHAAEAAINPPIKILTGQNTDMRQLGHARGSLLKSRATFFEPRGAFARLSTDGTATLAHNSR